LQLAISSNSSGMASKAAAVEAESPAAHAPELARKLLLTAATRGHVAAVQTLASCAPVQQCLDTGTVESVLEQLIKGDIACFQMVCAVPTAAQLDSAAFTRLLQAALRQGRQHRPGFVEHLLAFPTTQQFSADIVLQLLQALIKSRTAPPGGITAELCTRQAAQQLSSSAVEQLLFAALKRDISGSHNTCIQALCGLSAAGQWGSDTVARFLQAAHLPVSGALASWLCGLPELQQIDSAAVEKLIELALQNNRCVFTAHLLELPAAAQLSIDAMLRLTTSVLTCHGCDLYQGCMCCLLAHPMARQLGGSKVAQLLQKACARRCEVSTEQLCALPAAAGISTSRLVQILEAAVTTKYCVRALLRLPGAKQLNCDEIQWPRRW
jgi:hypothetical protein